MQQRLRTPLALSVLNLLSEQPMHPYEMQHLMRERGHDRVIKLKGGSLYSTIERLTAAGLIRTVETSREGRRPERTIYALTETGRQELGVWLRELLSRPMEEYPWFGAALAFLALLPPGEVLRLLEQRAIILRSELAAEESTLAAVARTALPRLFTLEAEYLYAVLGPEVAWVRRLMDGIRS